MVPVSCKAANIIATGAVEFVCNFFCSGFLLQEALHSEPYQVLPALCTYTSGQHDGT